MAGIQAPMARVAMVPSPRPLYQSSLQPVIGASSFSSMSFCHSVGELLGARVGEVDRHVGAVDLVRAAAGLPDQAGGEAGVTGVVGDVDLRVGLVQLAGRVEVLVPGGGHGDACTCRRPSCCRTAPSGRSPSAGRRPCRRRSRRSTDRGCSWRRACGAVRGQVGQALGEGELAERVVLDLGDVRDALAGLDGVRRAVYCLSPVPALTSLTLTFGYFFSKSATTCFSVGSQAQTVRVPPFVEGRLDVAGGDCLAARSRCRRSRRRRSTPQGDGRRRRATPRTRRRWFCA